MPLQFAGVFNHARLVIAEQTQLVRVEGIHNFSLCLRPALVSQVKRVFSHLLRPLAAGYDSKMPQFHYSARDRGPFAYFTESTDVLAVVTEVVSDFYYFHGGKDADWPVTFSVFAGSDHLCDITVRLEPGPHFIVAISP